MLYPFFVCLFVGIRPDKKYSTSCVGKEVHLLEVITLAHGQRHKPFFETLLLQGISNLILIAFITGNSSLEPLIEGLCAQIHVNLR